MLVISFGRYFYYSSPPSPSPSSSSSLSSSSSSEGNSIQKLFIGQLKEDAIKC